MSKKLDKKLKDLEKENTRLENIIEKKRDKHVADVQKLEKQKDKLLKQLKNLQEKRDKMDKELWLVFKAINKFEDMMDNMRIDRFDDKIKKLEEQKLNLKKQAVKYEKDISALAQTG